MRVGGPADYFARVTTITDLRDLVSWAHQVSLPYLILGGGSNVLVSDAGVRGLVIQNRCRQIDVVDQLPKEMVKGGKVEDGSRYLKAESGANMAGVARSSIRHGLTGLEWAVSVPGTIGGAVVNNAGAHGGEIKDNLAYAQVMDGPGQLNCYSAEALQYSYRHSILKSSDVPWRAGFGSVVLNALFQLDQAPAQEVKERADGFLHHRRRTQPVEPSLGSMFMNPPDDYAGRLIEAAGLKGTRIGGIEVSQQHANFIIHPGMSHSGRQINTNQANTSQDATQEAEGEIVGQAKDVMALIELIQKRVYSQFGVHLTPEVQLVGEWE